MFRKNSNVDPVYSFHSLEHLDTRRISFGLEIRKLWTFKFEFFENGRERKRDVNLKLVGETNDFWKKKKKKEKRQFRFQWLFQIPPG